MAYSCAIQPTVGTITLFLLTNLHCLPRFHLLSASNFQMLAISWRQHHTNYRRYASSLRGNLVYLILLMRIFQKKGDFVRAVKFLISHSLSHFKDFASSPTTWDLILAYDRWNMRFLLIFRWFKKMGFVDSLLEVVGFWLGIPIGILLGFLVFIYFEPRDFKKVR